MQYLIKQEINGNNVICFQEIINQLGQHWKMYTPPNINKCKTQQLDFITWSLDSQAHNIYTTQSTQDSTILTYLCFVRSIDALTTAAYIRTTGDPLNIYG